MNKLAILIAFAGLGLAPTAAVAAPASLLRPAADPATDGVLIEWSLGGGSIELVREDNALFFHRKPGDGSTIEPQQVRLVADGDRLVYLPTKPTDGRFFVVTSAGELQQHDPSGEIGIDGLAPELVTVREDQQKLLDTIAPATPDESDGPASWTDVINSLGGGEEKSAGGGEGTSPAVRVDPTRLDIVEQEDGTKLINERFVLAGEGTKERPYEITWDYLTSARETYQPRDGLKDIPAHVKMLDDSYVRIGGYLQFPLAAPEPKELLVMLNQWDGCCIGVPPTPYDAVEVSLATPATRGEKFAVEGALVGKLKIDPYLVGDWLIGLYLIGDASLDVSGSRSAEEVYGNSPTVGDPNAMPGG